MALTKNSVTVLTKYQPEAKKVLYNLAFDNSYLTGGEELDCTDHFKAINAVYVEGGVTNGYFIQAASRANHATGKVFLKMYRQTAATGPLVEVPNTTDVSAANSVNVIVEGATL